MSKLVHGHYSFTQFIYFTINPSLIENTVYIKGWISKFYVYVAFSSCLLEYLADPFIFPFSSG